MFPRGPADAGRFFRGRVHAAKSAGGKRPLRALVIESAIDEIESTYESALRKAAGSVPPPRPGTFVSLYEAEEHEATTASRSIAVVSFLMCFL